jgi:hypothetical protein
MAAAGEASNRSIAAAISPLFDQQEIFAGRKIESVDAYDVLTTAFPSPWPEHLDVGAMEAQWASTRAARSGRAHIPNEALHLHIRLCQIGGNRKTPWWLLLAIWSELARSRGQTWFRKN